MMRGFGFILSLIFIVLAECKSLAKSQHDRVYVVYMGKTTCENGDPRTDHVHLLNHLNQRKNNSIVHIYKDNFLGFAARLSDEEAESISKMPGVVSVFQDRPLELHTTRSWDFLWNLKASDQTFKSTPPSNSTAASNWWAGPYDTIIGIMDSGLWPEHPSFSDIFMNQIPTRWKGVCMPGEDENSTVFKCNKKVIGARYYDDPSNPGSILTARDKAGHGTHVGSIAGGSLVWGASYYDLAKGTARGGSPSSRIAVYRLCGSDGCPSSSILKGIDDAISDGVDVISLSLGGRYDDILNDSLVIGAFHAVEKGITVVCSAGNDGPAPGTIENYVPWVLSIGSSTIDRVFEILILLGGNKKIKGGGITFPPLSKRPIYGLIDGRSASINPNSSDGSNCVLGSLATFKVKGKIVLCRNKNNYNRLQGKITALQKQGAVGIIMIDNLLRTYNHYTYGIHPVAAVTEEDGAQIQSYINSTRNPMATILPTEVLLNYAPAPVVAYDSARGPIPGIDNLLKPDVTAPGFAILAAYPPINYTFSSIPDKKLPLFQLDTGTSMACPHASGMAATIKSHNPKWSSSAIKSAIITTAIPRNNLGAPITTENGSRATPYDMGAGEINPGALSPGLVYETETIDYVLFLCNLGYNETVIRIIASIVPDNFSCPDNSNPDLISDMNYPSISVSILENNGTRKLNRTVTNVGEAYSTYTAVVDAPPGVDVQVVPNKLHFCSKVKRQRFQVIFKLLDNSSPTLFGSLTWSSTKYTVRSPFVVTTKKEKDAAK